MNSFLLPEFLALYRALPEVAGLQRALRVVQAPRRQAQRLGGAVDPGSDPARLHLAAALKVLRAGAIAVLLIARCDGIHASQLQV
jgi:hypothetical protein